METRIVSAFPGIGKSYYFKENPGDSIDSDYSLFSWVKDENGKNTKERNPEFPGNYIKHIKKNIGNYKYIFVSSHKEVREALKEACLHFYLIYPGIARKGEFLERYEERGNPDSFINLIDENWESWITECALEDRCEKTVLTEGNLTDFLKII